MPDGRPYIAYQDDKKKLRLLVDVSFQNASSSHLLGAGGFKKVYSYYNVEKQAINAVSIQAITTKRQAAMARNELQILEENKNIPELLKVKCVIENVTEDADQANGNIITVMKKYDGDLNHFLDNYGKNFQKIHGQQELLHIKLLIFRKIVKVVASLNEKGIVNRDLKFQNVLYRITKKQILEIKVIDLGLACKKTDLDELSYRAGTGHYMPPEVLGHDLKTHPENIDSWALGVMLYKLYFNKRVPFANCIAKAVSNKNMHSADRKKLLTNEANKLIVDLKKKTADPLVQLIIELLAPEPSKRLASQDALKRINDILHLT